MMKEWLIVYFIRSDPDPVYHQWLDPDPVYPQWSDLDPVQHRADLLTDTKVIIVKRQ